MDVDGEWRAEDGRRSRSLGVAFMLAGLLRDVKWVSLSIGLVNMYKVTDDASNNSVNFPMFHHDVSIESSQLSPRQARVYKFLAS